MILNRVVQRKKVIVTQSKSLRVRDIKNEDQTLTSVMAGTKKITLFHVVGASFASRHSAQSDTGLMQRWKMESGESTDAWQNIKGRGL